MKTSEESKNLIKALVKVQAKLSPIKKDRENPFAGSKYVTLDAILEELLPKLNENGLVLVQSPVMQTTDTGMKVGVETYIYHETGEWAYFEPFFMELEKGSKMNMAQSAGSITTYAKRYAVSAIFGISSDEDTDGIQGKGEKQSNPSNNQKKYDNKNSDDKNIYQKQQEANRAELENRAQEIAKKSGKTIKEIQQAIVNAVNKHYKSSYKTFDQLDHSHAVGIIKTFELKLEENNQKVQQGALDVTQNTTTNIDWGRRNG